MDTTEQTIDSESESEPAGLIDLSRVRLRELWSLDESTVLDHSLARAIGTAERHHREAVSAFNSAI